MTKKLKNTLRQKIEILIGLCFISKRKLIKYIYYVDEFRQYHTDEESYPEKYEDWCNTHGEEDEEDEEEEE